MKALYKIGDLSQQLDITTRTLRYYEEVGLIQSTKKPDSQYRHYDEESITRINQIILLRRLSFSIKEIQTIFLSGENDNIMPILVSKLSTLKSERVEQESLIYVVEKLIKTLETNMESSSTQLSALESIQLMEKDVVVKPFLHSSELKKIINNKLLGEIRIIKLRPMKVAYHVANSHQPEKDAWHIMNQWVRDNELEEQFTTRYLGFNNPDPTKESDVYGYEAWVTISGEVSLNDAVDVKDVEGGLYAVASTNMYDIVQSWQLLYKLINQNPDYTLGEHRWLEEHLIVDEGSWGSNMQVDLYCPIKMYS